MMPCIHCQNSGRATLYLCAGGWAGCIRVRASLHIGISGQKEQDDVVAWLQGETGREIDTWDVVQVEQKGQAKLL